MGPDKAAILAGEKPGASHEADRTLHAEQRDARRPEVSASPVSRVNLAVHDSRGVTCRTFAWIVRLSHVGLRRLTPC
jgi:hypothetical protein